MLPKQGIWNGNFWRLQKEKILPLQIDIKQNREEWFGLGQVPKQERQI